MSLYDLPKLKPGKLKFPRIKFLKFWKQKVFWLIILVIFISSFFGFLAGLVSGSYFYSEVKTYLSELNIELPEPTTIIKKEYFPQVTQEELIIKVVKNAAPTVVSIIVTKDVPIFEEYYYNPFEGFEEFFDDPLFQYEIPQYREIGTEKIEVGGGTGFIISEDGMILTNKHVVSDKQADYTVFTNDEERYSAKVLARDPAQDLAVIKIEQEENKEKKVFPILTLGDSQELQIGQTVIAIGNALGEFQNTVSVGVISGLGRNITAFGGGLIETLEGVIQTDAAINLGNSGGPLLNLQGEVIGINTALSVQGENIGFALPINKAKKDIEQVKTLGKIVYPFLGVRYVLITEKIQEKNDLSVDYGAWIIGGDEGEPAVFPDSAAEKIGLKEYDIILEFDGKKITVENTLAKVIMEYNPGDKIDLKILRDEEEKIIPVTLGEKSD